MLPEAGVRQSLELCSVYGCGLAGIPVLVGHSEPGIESERGSHNRDFAVANRRLAIAAEDSGSNDAWQIIRPGCAASHFDRQPAI